ncbi:MAG: hypothetical protein EOO00_01290 [Chitinophagaceae bacterium]|nr:MAG: hypothetical protein EOO00_01290 [Chitinophagaceae bacterium]
MKNRLFYFTGLLLLVSLFLSEDSFAQRRKRNREKKPSIYDIDTLVNRIPIQRKMWHDRIDAGQKSADVSDGVIDQRIYYVDDTLSTRIFSQSVLKDVDHIQVMIENLPYNERPDDEGREKTQYLKDLQETVKRFVSDPRRDPVYWRRVVNNFRELVIARHQSRLLAYVMLHPDAYTLANASLLEGHAEAKDFLYKEMGRKDPRNLIKRLSEYANEPFACDVIATAARVVPNEIYNYASSTNYSLSGAVRRCPDSLVQTIVRIADQSKSPLRAMPFLSDIYNRKKTIQEIDQITKDQDLFFKNLVRLKLENEKLGGETYSDELMYRGLKYVREMNDLHDSPDPVRFRIIDGMKPEELYFIMVYGQDEIYTSSFVGTFNRMIQRMGDSVKGGDLLANVHYDKFRTFIRMCAGYNTLSTFLGKMGQEQKMSLMQDFIAGLDKGEENDLEDAVDVADAFGSISDTALLDFLRLEVKNNYERSYKNKSMKGMRVYALLATLFNGLKASDNAAAMEEQSEILGLNPINIIKYKNLQSDSGIVYQQFFFYGDEDGKASYNNFLGNFRNGKWKKTDSKYWTTIRSTSGKPVVIYANLPLSEPEDEEAQKQLCNYLAGKGIQPTIMVHRGHSYHLPVTMDRFQRSSRVVFLGSCGGYHNLGTVLDKSPDAHIISSKQTGTMLINDKIVEAINSRLLEGKDIDWISMWKDLGVYFTTKKPGEKSRFSDYVPPHKNLGAIFIKAYRHLSASEDELEDESIGKN